MTKRSVQEIEQEIKEYNDEYIEIRLSRKTYCTNRINQIVIRLRNLYLELNRAKQRDWIERR